LKEHFVRPFLSSFVFTRIEWFRLAMAVMLVVCSAAAASAQLTYRFIDLVPDFYPYRISEAGLIVGRGPQRGNGPALLWQNGMTTDLGEGEAQDVNSQGQVLLSIPLAGDGRPAPHVWQNGIATPLAIPPWNSDFRHYYAMNSSGQVVGQALDRAFLWSNGQLIYLDATFAGENNSAYAINDIGQIVGRAGSNGFLWDHGAVTLLPDSAMDVNNSGQVLGESSIWHGGNVTDLPPLPLLAGSIADMWTLRGQAINALGQVVANQTEQYLIDEESGQGTRHRMLLWDSVRGSYDLNDLAADADFALAGSFVADINAAGQIVGYSGNGGFLLTPVPALEADFDEDGDVDGNDLAFWKPGFGASGNADHMDGDADGDLDVDGADFLAWQRQLSGTPAVAANGAVPEPATLLLVVSGVLAIFLRRRAAVS